MTIDPIISWKYKPAVTLATLQHQQRATHILLPGEIIDVATSANAGAHVEVGAARTLTNMAASITTQFGPYNATTELRVTSTAGVVTLTIARLN